MSPKERFFPAFMFACAAALFAATTLAAEIGGSGEVSPVQPFLNYVNSDGSAQILIGNTAKLWSLDHVGATGNVGRLCSFERYQRNLAGAAGTILWAAQPRLFGHQSNLFPTDIANLVGATQMLQKRADQDPRFRKIWEKAQQLPDAELRKVNSFESLVSLGKKLFENDVHSASADMIPLIPDGNHIRKPTPWINLNLVPGKLEVRIAHEDIRKIEQLQRKLGLKSLKEFFNTAITLMHWVVEKRNEGYSIASLDETNKTWRELVMPTLDSGSAPKAENQPAPILEGLGKLQLQLDPDRMSSMVDIFAGTGIRSYEGLLDSAYTLLNWAVEQRRAGRIIGAVNESKQTYRELKMDALDRLAPSGPASTIAFRKPSSVSFGKNNVERIHDLLRFHQNLFTIAFRKGTSRQEIESLLNPHKGTAIEGFTDIYPGDEHNGNRHFLVTISIRRGQDLRHSAAAIFEGDSKGIIESIDPLELDQRRDLW